MSAVAPCEEAVLECGSASAALDGVSGDLAVVAEFSGGALVAVIDGLGHGDEAAAAARAAARILESSPGEPVSTLVQRCHEGLRETRGAVMTLASIDARAETLEWIGVGNVEAVLLRADASAQPPREALTIPGGVVGYQLPSLRSRRLAVGPGDLLVFWTDGVGEFARSRLTGSAQEIAGAILSEHRLGSDDALVLVARYRGAPTGPGPGPANDRGLAASRGARDG